MLAGVALLAMSFAAQVASSQSLVVDTFANASSVNVGSVPGIDWVNYRGLTVNQTWDPNQQSPGNPNPGAMYVTVDWPATNASDYSTSWIDMQFGFDTSGVFDTSNYIAFACDILVDVTNSSLALDGSDYGAIELIVNNPWDNVVGWAQLLNTNGWQHFSGFFSAMGSAQGDHSQAIVGLIAKINVQRIRKLRSISGVDGEVRAGLVGRRQCDIGIIVKRQCPRSLRSRGVGLAHNQ